MSHQATTWALYDVEPGIVSDGARFTLLALADHARPDGTAAFPKVRTLAELLAATERTIHRHLAALEDAGLIRRGDQSLVNHYPGNYRPVVWDLALPPRGDKPVRSGRGDAPVRGDTQVSGLGVTPGVSQGTTSSNNPNTFRTSEVTHDRAREPQLVPAPARFRDLVKATSS